MPLYHQKTGIQRDRASQQHKLKCTYNARMADTLPHHGSHSNFWYSSSWRVILTVDPTISCSKKCLQATWNQEAQYNEAKKDEEFKTKKRVLLELTQFDSLPAALHQTWQDIASNIRPIYVRNANAVVTRAG